MSKNKIFVSSFIALILVASVFAISNDPVFSSSDDVSDIAEITDDISASDVVESEENIDATNSRFTKRTISSGSGWVTTDNKGALASIHLVSGYAGSEVKSFGWMKFGKLKLRLESTESTETKKTFAVSVGENRNVIGTIVLNRESTYQEGFAVWAGTLNIEVVNTETGNTNYNSKVNLAIEERALGDQKIKEQRESTQISATGGLELGSLSFELTGKSKASLERMEFELTGRENAKGTLVLEKSSGDQYVGKLKIVAIGSNGDEDKTVGTISGTLKSEGNTLYGPVKFVSEEGNADEGNIKIAFTRTVSSSSDDSKDSDDSDDDKKEDRSGSNSGSDKARLDRSLVQRLIDFFNSQ